MYLLSDVIRGQGFYLRRYPSVIPTTVDLLFTGEEPLGELSAVRVGD